MNNAPLFFRTEHPFAWTTPRDRIEVLENVEDPVWHRFLEEADAHFSSQGELTARRFPLFCHDGDLDEVMAAAVIAYVRGDLKLFGWIAGWLRELIAYFDSHSAIWAENLQRIMRGDLPAPGNPRQFFEGFTKGNHYWVESGLMSTVLHLFDLLEAYVPGLLSGAEKGKLCLALANFADRFAFHEEAFKYSNRGMWANGALLVSGIVHSDPEAARILLHRAEQRNREYRSTFFDDGMHAEGAPDYHLMAVDALLCFALTAGNLWKGKDYFAASSDGDSPFGVYPCIPDTVRAYLRTVIPGPMLWNDPRGCSVSIPIPLRPALISAYARTRDPEIGWFIRQRLGDVEEIASPLRVTCSSLLGLGHYQPLLNFWLYRSVEKAIDPERTFDVLPDHGALFSRSGWDSKASFVTARFGFQGTAKGHNDHGHVAVVAGGRPVLSDPFPRFGPRGLDTSLFHNTVTLDNAEPPPVLGLLKSVCHLPHADAFLIQNSGGRLPRRSYLHDPREEANYWFTMHPREADFEFLRAILHLHEGGIVGVDLIVPQNTGESVRRIDGFFHTPLCPAGYAREAEARSESYRLQQRSVDGAPEPLQVEFRGGIDCAEAGIWLQKKLASETATFRILSLDAPLELSTGHHAMRVPQSCQATTEAEEMDYFLRSRVEAPRARIIWSLDWGGDSPEITYHETASALQLRIGSAPSGFDLSVDFENALLRLEYAKATPPAP